MDNEHDTPQEIDPIHGPTQLIKRKDGKTMRKQPTKTQYIMRVQQVVTWLLDGYASREVMRKIRDKWGITTRPADYMIAQAREQIETMAATEGRAAITLALLRLTELYDKALREGDNKTALDVIKTQNRMLGLNAPERTEVKAVENWNNMNVAEQLEYVGSILDRAQNKRQTN
jgi:hypothetical protein